MARAATVAVLLAAIAAGCLGRSSAHGVMTAAQAQAQAVRDGLARPQLQHDPSSWRCTSTPPYLGQLSATMHHRGYVHPRYSLVAGDRRIPPRGGSARATLLLVVLPRPSAAARCARSILLYDEHLSSGVPATRYKVVDRATIVVDPHPPGVPGTLPGTTGQYDIAFAGGPVLALGLADNRHASALVEADLRKLAGEIAG
ncbi:MAG TPA: hypothetical protein VFW18_10380 [Gaiellales bacterium]|nr:hypothetical protein [Gaiellales bacterium]